jgi:multiple sugar transport system permease protein
MSAVVSGRRPVRPQRLVGRTLGYLLLIVLSVIFIGPQVWMVLTSLKSATEVFGGPFFPQHPTLDAYAFLVNDLGIGSYFVNSVIVTGLTVIGVVVVAALAGYAFAFLPIPGKNVVFGVLLIALLLPAALFLIPGFI